MTKRVYNAEFKQTIVSLYESGKTVSELCREFGVSTASVNRWKLKYISVKSSETIAFTEDLSSLSI